MLTSDLTFLAIGCEWGKLAPPFMLCYFIYLESDTFIVVSYATMLDALESVWWKIQIRILTYGISQSRIMQKKSTKEYILILSIA